MFKKFLFSSAAFANPGALAMASYQRSPDPSALVRVVEELNENTPAIEQDDMLRRSKDIASMLSYWDKTDAIIEGYETIRLAGNTFLPRFENEKEEEYKVRLALTKFTNIYRDIVEGLSSKPFEEEVSLVTSDNVEIPEEFEEFIEDVDGAGNNITSFLSLTFFNGVNSAIDWIFVDYPTVDNSIIRTKADQKAANIKPYWSHVLARNVLWVTTRTINSKQEITYIKIFEPDTGGNDAVRIFQKTEDGRVIWNLWRKNEQSDSDGKIRFSLEAIGTLSIPIIPLVPFTTGRRDGSTWKFFPAMQDAADLQIELYQQESGLKFIKTMAAYPMLAANGLKPQMEADGKTPKKVAVGPMRVLYGIPDGNGNHGEWKYIEPTAASMKFLAEDIKETKQDLRELGRQPLTATSGNLTVITTAVAAGKARSAVGAWALNLKDAAENALRITGLYMKSDYEPEVNVYNEFDNFTDGNADLAELGNARRAGDLSRETYYVELKRRKVLSAEFDAEEEVKRLLKEIPGEPDMDNSDDDPQQQPGNAA